MAIGPVEARRGTADELSRLAGSKSQGVITDAEFERQKARWLA